MKGIDMAAAVLAVVLVAGTIVYNIRKKMRGDANCGYNCEGCKDHKKEPDNTE